MLGETSDAAAPKVLGLPRRGMLLGVGLGVYEGQEEVWPGALITYERCLNRSLAMAEPWRRRSC